MSADPSPSELYAAAARLLRLASRLEARIARADEWLDDRTPDGYPTSSGGSSPIGHSSEPSSPVLTAIISTPAIPVKGDMRDLRSIRNELTARLAIASAAVISALDLCNAVPRAASGPQAARIDYEKKHSRCEGWGPKYAVCDDLAVQRTVVDGSTHALCHACYQAMWRQTDNGPTGRTSRKAPA